MFLLVLLLGGMPVLLLCSLTIVRSNPLMFPAVGALIVLQILQRNTRYMGRDERDSRTAFGILFSVQTAITLAGAWLVPCIGSYLLAAGYVCNLSAIALNGLRMPMAGKTSHPCYASVGPDTRLPWLCDIIKSGPEADPRWAFSLGDVLEMAGLWALSTQLLLTHLPS